MGIIRVALALSVLIWHSPIKTGDYLPLHGSYAVQVFFVISGFYMALILTEKYHDRRLFYENRLLRLFPLYLAVVVLQFILNLLTHADHAWFTCTQLLNPVSMFLLIMSNLTLVGQDLLMFVGINPESGMPFLTANFYKETMPAYEFLLVPQAWTVSLELMFYICAPWLVTFRGRWLVLIMLCSLAVRYSLSRLFGLVIDPWSYRFFPSELVFFAAGIFAYRAYVLICYRQIKIPTYMGWLLVTGVVGLVGTSYYLPAIHNRVIPALLIAMLIPFIFMVTKRNRIDRYIGDLSYGIYITHIMVIGLIRYISPGNVPSIWVVVGTIPVAMLLQYLVERPVNRYRQQRAMSELQIGRKDQPNVTPKTDSSNIASIAIK